MTAQPLGLAGHAISRLGWHWLAPAVAMAAAASGARQRTPGLASTDWTCFPRLAQRTPGTDTRSVGTARDFCLSTMRRWGVQDRGDDVAVVVSELLTNALRHAVPQARAGAGPAARSRWPVRLGLVQPGHFVLCAVADPSPRLPEPKEPDYLAESGRGLHVISALQTGVFAYHPGISQASSDEFKITVTGRQTHAAFPWAGVDPIAVTVTTALILASPPSSLP